MTDVLERLRLLRSNRDAHLVNCDCTDCAAIREIESNRAEIARLREQVEALKELRAANEEFDDAVSVEESEKAGARLSVAMDRIRACGALD